jgi:hypothetical protein
MGLESGLRVNSNSNVRIDQTKGQEGRFSNVTYSGLLNIQKTDNASLVKKFQKFYKSNPTFNYSISKINNLEISQELLEEVIENPNKNLFDESVKIINFDQTKNRQRYINYSEEFIEYLIEFVLGREILNNINYGGNSFTLKLINKEMVSYWLIYNFPVLLWFNDFISV